MALTLDDLFASPDHYLHSFEGDAAVFVAMDRAAYHRSIFLDGRISPAGSGSMRVPLAMLTNASPAVPASTGWIFHVAHCGSTLLARALDRSDGSLVLREPLALRQTALAADPARLALVARMLAKRYRAQAPTLIKANVPVNFVLPELLAAAGDTRSILLYCDLPDYVLAILRSDNHRAWLRRVTEQLAPHLGDLSGASDAARAGALWLAQMRAFAATLQRGAEARSLNAERLFAAPASVLGEASAHFGTPMPAAEINALVAGPLFSTYSKNPDTAFSNDARIARREALAKALAGEIDDARRWLEPHSQQAEQATAAIVAARLG